MLRNIDMPSHITINHKSTWWSIHSCTVLFSFSMNTTTEIKTFKTVVIENVNDRSHKNSSINKLKNPDSALKKIKPEANPFFLNKRHM